MFHDDIGDPYGRCIRFRNRLGWFGVEVYYYEDIPVSIFVPDYRAHFVDSDKFEKAYWQTCHSFSCFSLVLRLCVNDIYLATVL